MRSRSRVAVTLSEPLHRRLNSYAIAATAAGVSVLALAPRSEAKIVYTKTHQVIGFNGVYALDVNNDGIFDFVLTQWYDSSPYFGVSALGLVAKPGIGNALVGTSKNLGRFASALYRGARIGATQHFLNSPGSRSGATMANVSVRSSRSGGPWKNVDDRYLGMKFQLDGKTHYGWARLSVHMVNGITATLTGYAYETVPNRPIRAGRTQGGNDASPPSTGASNSNSFDLSNPKPNQAFSLGSLARGAQGGTTWRQQ
jgi:hypothetical protein